MNRRPHRQIVAEILVHGSIKDAILSANLHGIRLAAGIGIGRASVQATVEANEADLIAWFLADLGQKPAPSGSLLYWDEVKA